MFLNLLGFRAAVSGGSRCGARIVPAVATILAMSPVAVAKADVLISSGPTQNMACSNGVCAPTAADATLNVTDLKNLLASGKVKVTTTGSGVQANNIVVSAPFGCQGSSSLAVDAYQSISVRKTISIKGKGGLALTTNDGGTGGALTFGQHGRAVFQNLTSELTINGAAYTLVADIKSLAIAVGANPAGNFALVRNYNAHADGAYPDAAVKPTLTGNMQGLGNTISNLSILHHAVRGERFFIGLFAETGPVASIASVRLKKFDIKAKGSRNEDIVVGGLVGESEGFLFDDHVSGFLNAQLASVGGLAGGEDGDEGGIIGLCTANVHITTTDEVSWAGGLVGTLGGGSIELSYSTGTIPAVNAGGLVGYSTSEVINSYSNVAVGVVNAGDVGGLIGGDSRGGIHTSYASGVITGSQRPMVGGLVGDYSATETDDNYWDTTTSGTDDGIGGGNTSGITGLTTQQLQSGLPTGFDPTIWAENASINNGLPYLINNPPE